MKHETLYCYLQAAMRCENSIGFVSISNAQVSGNFIPSSSKAFIDYKASQVTFYSFSISKASSRFTHLIHAILMITNKIQMREHVNLAMRKLGRVKFFQRTHDIIYNQILYKNGITAVHWVNAYPVKYDMALKKYIFSFHFIFQSV